MKDTGVKEEVSILYQDVIKGLQTDQKYLPSKYFYDDRGSDLFEQICELEEYYPTDCEMEIMRDYINEISDWVGPGVQLIELGSGSSTKTRLLLDHCQNLAMYVPVDISGSFLKEIAKSLNHDYPELDIHPVAADYTTPFDVPDSDNVEKRVVYYPGSTIGNFTRKRAASFMNAIGENLSPGDGLLIGVDLKKEVGVLEAAYNDSKGVTAEFNKNILTRLNRELDSDFDVEQFQHRAFYNSKKGRIEMHLESLADQSVKINGDLVSFKKGETIHTENSHKYSVEEFEEIAGDYFERRKTWTDKRDYFSVHYFERV
ncbi:MAG: L-histidine N(alpha)-methyltransferase [Bacteroidetes bacterium]|jgi:dimethylhistidine N-methyltransferase|nr:L-histidine N(alpha)-methyltransferase [Bacteroidota bacterium]